ncbi:MAG: hypothetical protein MUC63_04625 [Planctomycetes bacterium]|nr:hypothetical protein [Planctomycetota bacterium]
MAREGKAETVRGTGDMAFPPGHPGRGALANASGPERPGARSLAEVARPEAVGDGGMEFALSFPEGSFQVRLEGALTRAFRGIGEDPADLLRKALDRIPDRERLVASLKGRAYHGVLLSRSDHPFEEHRRGGHVGVHRAVFSVADSVVRRILLQVGIVHQLRHEALPPSSPVTADLERTLIRMDAGLFLLLLGRNARRMFFLPRILRDTDALFDPACGFRDVLVPILSRLRFVKPEDPAESPFGAPYVNGNAFDALPATRKLQVVLGGLLAWYTVITFGVLRPFRRLFLLLTPYFGAAQDMLRGSFAEGFLVKRGFIGRAARAFFRGNIGEAIEFFWSGWNPVLARVTTRPVFRLLGGNRRPVLATVTTFLYTACVVHFLWLVALVLLAFRLAYERDPAFALGRLLGANANFYALLGALGGYLFFALFIAFTKARRSRRSARGPGGSAGTGA